MGTRKTETVALDKLKPHPKNYKKHPKDQLEHIQQSLKQFGFYRNVVVARDNTILAGHGVVEAAILSGLKEAPVFRLDLDPNDPAALKVLTLDNELGKFAETDDRALTDLLKQISETDIAGLLGTGFDEKMLAALVMTTRPAAELADFDAAAEWVGMPEYEPGEAQIKLVITFPSEADRAKFIADHGMRIDKKAGLTFGTRWPFSEREDVAGLRFESEGEAPADSPAEAP